MEVFVVADDEDPEIQTRSGPVRMQNKYISDATAVCQLTVWGNDIDQIKPQKSYLLTDVNIKSFNNKKHLSTTKATGVTNIAKVERIDPEETTINAELLPIQISTILQCLACNNHIYTTTPIPPTIRCENCSDLQTTAHMTTLTHKSLATFKDITTLQHIRLKFTSSCIEKVIREVQAATNDTDMQVTETFLLTYNDHFLVTYSPTTNHVTSFATP